MALAESASVAKGCVESDGNPDDEPPVAEAADVAAVVDDEEPEDVADGPEQATPRIAKVTVTASMAINSFFMGESFLQVVEWVE